MIFTEKDKELLKLKGIDGEQIRKQIEIFKSGIPFVNLEASATEENGICVFSDEEKQYYKTLFEQNKEQLDLLKFVPASGAATRMFKSLFKFVTDFNSNEQTFDDYVNAQNATDIEKLFICLEKFPFSSEISAKIENSEASECEKKHRFVKEMLLEDGFDYGNFPKGLLPFHGYKNHVATAFEEHLYEAALYNESKGISKLHFTISEAHTQKFAAAFEKIKAAAEKDTGVRFEVSFSYQKAATDTIAVTMENEPFRNDDKSLLFRPSGHGALIENLNEQDADIISIKNIDNVVVKKYKKEVADYKKILAGKLLEVQKTAFEYAELLADNSAVLMEKLAEIKQFLQEQLNISFDESFEEYSRKEQSQLLVKLINRPIRVCGMVKNEGEPGGGPFWVKDKEGTISLQIIESAQIDSSDKNQLNILKESTHFNPVDLVCGVRNYKGEKYNLTDFVDPTQGFITQKTSQGRDLKALELPGLWNGAMANWNTIFVEVPLITFNPVKTVNDLLKPAHQSN